MHLRSKQLKEQTLDCSSKLQSQEFPLGFVLPGFLLSLPKIQNLWMCRDNSGQQLLSSSEKMWSHPKNASIPISNNRHTRRKTGLILCSVEIFRREINLIEGTLPMAKGWNWMSRKPKPFSGDSVKVELV